MSTYRSRQLQRLFDAFLAADSDATVFAPRAKHELAGRALKRFVNFAGAYPEREAPPRPVAKKPVVARNVVSLAAARRNRLAGRPS